MAKRTLLATTFGLIFNVPVSNRTATSLIWLFRAALVSLTVCFLLAGFTSAALGQQQPDPRLLTFINSIRVIDNHCHDLPAPDAKYIERDLPDPIGKSLDFFDARQRETNPRWIQAWRALYGYTKQDLTQEHVGELFRAKQRLMRDKGANYPAWVLDQIGIEVALVNAPQLGAGQSAPRFRWVPFADGFLFPFESRDPTGNVQRRRREIGLDKPPASLSEYLDQVVKRQLQQWKSDGAIAIKFQIAYYRSLDFANVKENDAKAAYERFIQGGAPSGPDYKLLQDFLFRYVAREAGRLGLSVHIHTGEGGGPFFGTAGSNPLLLESVLNDYTLQGTIFVLVHGGYPFDRVVASLIKKPNVYTDISGQSFFRSRDGLSETLQPWLEAFPEKIMFGTDAFELSPLRSWEEMAWISTKTGREALALALTKMMTAGDITRPRAEEIARMVMRENATKLYGLK